MKVFMRAFIVAGIMLLSGCGGLIDWSKETFDQGKNHSEDRETIDAHMRVIKIYDQFETVALFDVLWLSDEVRSLYAQSHSAIYGRNPESSTAFLRRQLKTNEHFVSFYVLSTHAVPLNEKPPLWSVYLKVGENTYQPLEMKAVELSPEYRKFFGKRLTNHRRPYEIRFERQDNEGRDILEGAQAIELFFSNPKHFAAVSWDNVQGTQNQKV